MPRIFIIEDDPKIIAAIQKSFSLEPDFESQSISVTTRAVEEVAAYKPDLVLLDIKLPQADGRQIVKQLKDNPGTSAIPVIFLTGMSSEGDRVLGLNLGADDYLVKPFGAMELVARIKAVLRRARPQKAEDDLVCIGDLAIDAINRTVSWKGEKLRLQPKEFDVLLLLASHPGKTVSRRSLIEQTSHYEADVASRSLDTHIKNLRKKLGPAGEWIETIPKLGYSFSPPT